MNKSETLKELASALSKAQSQIKGALKDSSNPFFKTKYADLASVVEAIREPLSSNGLSYVQISHNLEDAAGIETVILHSSGEWLSCGLVVAPVTKKDAQGFGSAMTYARRYGLSAAFGVAPEDDDGNGAAKAAPVGHEKVDGQNTAGQLSEQELSMEGLETEVRNAIRGEANDIEADFYTVSTKKALERWSAFKKDASEQEIEACWKHINPTVRRGIKAAGEKAA